MAAPPYVPRKPRAYRGTPAAPAPQPVIENPELRNAEPAGFGEQVGQWLDAASDGPVSTFLANTVKGVAGAPATRLAARSLPFLQYTGKADDFDDFLTTMSAKRGVASGTDAGQMVGAALPELMAYTAISTAGATMGAHGVKIAARTAAIDKYFRALADPRLPGLAKPAIVRAGEILGTAIANGGLAGGEAAATGQPDPLRAAAQMGMMSLAVEGGLTGVAKAVSRGAREVSKQAIAARYAGSPARAYLQTAEQEFQQKLLAQTKLVDKAIDNEMVERQLQGLVPAWLPAKPSAARAFAKAQKTGLAEAVGTRVEAIRKVHQATGSLAVARKYAAISEREVLAGAYLSERPTNFDSTFGSLRAAWRRASATPDAIRKEIGVAGENALRSIDDAVLLGFGRGNSSLEMLDRSKKAVESVVGKKLARNVLHDLEEGGEAQVRATLAGAGYKPHHADMVMKQLDLVTGGGDALHQIVNKFGGEAALDTVGMGVNRHIPHLQRRGSMPQDKFVASMERHLVRKGFTPEEATRRALDVIEARKARGFQRFGSIDDRRKIPGSTREKIASGMTMEADPWKAYAQYYVGMHQRIALSQVLGFKNEMLKPLVHAVELEAGPGAASLFRSSIDSMAGLKYYNQLGERVAQTVTNLEAAAKMGFSFVPNAFQFGLNNPLVYGLRNSFKGIAEMSGKHTPADLQQALGFMATDFFDLGLRSNMMSDMSEGVTSKIARAVLSKLTPFSVTEQFNRGSAAFGAHAVMADILAKTLTGRMRGERLTFARKVFEEAGLDLARVTREGITKEEYITGALRLMRRTQFSAGEGTRAIRPLAWQHPLGRVMTQFNTFTLNQGRLIRDFVFNEIAKGNKKQLARFLGMYLPMAEVSVGVQESMRELVSGTSRERPTNPAARAIEDIVMAGSFGMANTMLWAARGGKMEKLLGPAITDFFTYGEALMAGRLDEVGRRVASLPSARLFSAFAEIGYMGGKMAQEAADKYMTAYDADDPGDEGANTANAPTLSDFREAERENRAVTRRRRRSYR